MAFNATNPVTVGSATKKDHYDRVFDNTLLLKTSISNDGLEWSGRLVRATAAVTASTPLIDHAQTWNNGAVTFTGWKLNATDTASAVASLLLDLQLGGVSQFSVGKAGATEQLGASTITRANIGTTSTDGQILKNATPAAAGAQQYSPRTYWEGQGWKTNATAASQSVAFAAEVQPVQGAAAPTGNWVLKASIAGGAFSNVFQVTSGGQALHAGGSAAAPGSAGVSDPDTGWWWPGSNLLVAATGGVTRVEISTSSFGLKSDMAFGWYDGGFSSIDTSLARAAAKVVVFGPTTGVRLNWATADALAVQDFAGSAGAKLTSGAFAMVNKLTPAALASGATNDWNPGTVAANGFLVAEANAAGSTLNGIVSTNVVSGQIYILQNLGSGTLTLAQEAAGSTAAYRFRSTGSAATVPPGGACFIAYDGVRWNVLKAN